MSGKSVRNIALALGVVAIAFAFVLAGLYGRPNAPQDSGPRVAGPLAPAAQSN